MRWIGMLVPLWRGRGEDIRLNKQRVELPIFSISHILIRIINRFLLLLLPPPKGDILCLLNLDVNSYAKIHFNAQPEISFSTKNEPVQLLIRIIPKVGRFTKVKRLYYWLCRLTQTTLFGNLSWSGIINLNIVFRLSPMRKLSPLNN